MQDKFIRKAQAAMAAFILPSLDEQWLIYRNELNFTINEDAYHRLKKEKSGRAMTIEELKHCATGEHP